MSTRTSRHSMEKRSSKANSEPPQVNHKELQKAVNASMKRMGMNMEASWFNRSRKRSAEHKALSPTIT